MKTKILAYFQICISVPLKARVSLFHVFLIPISIAKIKTIYYFNLQILLKKNFTGHLSILLSTRLVKDNWPPFDIKTSFHIKIKSTDKLKMKLSHWSKITHWLCLTSKKQTHMLPYFENFNSNFITLLSPRMLSIQNYHYYFHCHLRYSFKLKFLLNLQGGSPKILCHVTSDVKLSHFFSHESSGHRVL